MFSWSACLLSCLWQKTRPLKQTKWKQEPPIRWLNRHNHYFLLPALLRLSHQLVPWPNQRPSLERWRITVDSCYNVPYSLRCKCPDFRKTQTDKAKIAYIISLLSSWALQRAQAILYQDNTLTTSLENFVTQFKDVFGQTNHNISVHEQLYNLPQGKSTIGDYTIHW